MSILSAPYFHDEAAAVEYLEGIVWADGISCPKCGTIDNAHYKIKGQRPGLRCCKWCRKQFTVKVGTVFESSHIPLHKWLQAAYLMSASKKGISAHQLHRTLEVTYKTAWFMAHRLREAMRVLKIEPMGGEGKVVEADETYVGGLEKNKHMKERRANGVARKEPVFALVERSGKVRSIHIQSVNAETLGKIMREQLYPTTHLMTDDGTSYKRMSKHFAAHEVVCHSAREYVRGGVHTNTIEGYFSIFKRGMKGVYQHCSAEHLKRYLAEFDFRYNERNLTDGDRTVIALQGISGKRLTYSQ